MKIFYCYLIVGLGTIGYLLTNHFTFFSAHQLPLLSIDILTPFLPWTVLIYLGMYAFILVVPFILKKDEQFLIAYWSASIIIVVSLLTFLFFPTTYPLRPRPAQYEQSVFAFIYSGVHFFDSTKNCFPSLHVSLVFLLSLLFYKEKPKLFIVYFVGSILVSISTLTTKQHYLLDVIAAFVLVFAVYVPVRRFILRDKP